ncbi:MAG: hypothetical protein HC912_06815 [Saprospiraceae bacterium]|nr:hypothetical protein [Saprospiraceae bacterium]
MEYKNAAAKQTTPNNILIELLSKIRDDYKYKDVAIDRHSTPAINYQMDIELLEWRCRNYFQGKTEQIRIEVQSLLDGFWGKRTPFSNGILRTPPPSPRPTRHERAKRRKRHHC